MASLTRREGAFGRREITMILFVAVAILFLCQHDLSWKDSIAIPTQSGAVLSGLNNLGQAGLASPSFGQATVEDARSSWHGSLPPTSTVLKHVPGYTIFDNLYMLNGTIYIVSDEPTKVPEIRQMTSSGAPVFNGDEEVRKREPSEHDMQVITPQQARELFGESASRLDGVTFLFNDPPQFINHYYHFAAELMFGIWRAYTSLDSDISSTGRSSLPPPRRLIFPHTPTELWRDYSTMNQYIMHAQFPSAALEFQMDWQDRADTLKPFKFDRVVYADRAAAMRGESFLATGRLASSAFNLPGGGRWWAPMRNALTEFAGSSRDAGAGTEQRPVITYVSRQGWGRRMLRNEDHNTLVNALRRLEQEYGWEVNVVSMDKLSRQEQVQLAARTTILMGVHGNGLTALLWMNPTPRATVIEFFAPGGFAFDYEWTTRAIGMTHFGFWGSNHFTSPDLPPPAYPEGFHGNDIPLDGEAVAALVVHQLSLNAELDD